MRDAGTRLALIKMSSTYADLVLLIIWSWDTIASITDFIITGATFSQNPNRVRQKHWPLKMTVWNGHSALSTWIWRYAFRRSRSDTLTPCRRHSLSFCTHTLAVNCIFPGTAMLYVQGHYIWSNVSHDKPCTSNCLVSLGDPVSSPSPCGWDHHTCSRQIFYRHCTPLILKVFVWQRQRQFCRAFVVSHDSSRLG